MKTSQEVEAGMVIDDGIALFIRLSRRVTLDTLRPKGLGVG